MQSKEFVQASMKECRITTDKAFENWSQALRQTVRMSACHEDLEATIKAFVQVDSISKNTKTSLEKTNKALDMILEKKTDMSEHFKTLDEIQHLLDIKHIIKDNWTRQ